MTQKIVRQGTTPVQGIGRPDYSRAIATIKRGELYPQFEPRPDTEKYKIFFLTFTPAAPLAPLATAHFLDIETLLPAPYTSPAGIVGDFREWFFSGSQDVEFVMLMDGVLPLAMVIEAGSMIHQYEQIVWGKTTMLDPTSALPHTWDFTIKNLGPGNLVGSFHTALVLAVP